MKPLCEKRFMRKFIVTLAAFICWLVLAPTAEASNCARDQYMHNGSLMDYEVCDGGRITISYARPRPGMVRQGVRQGTLLFDGYSGASGVINGTARLFSARCGVVTYAVSGREDGNVIQLNGTAPIRGAGCAVTRYRQDNLVFTLASGGTPGGPGVVQPQCPPGFVLSGSQCIRQGAPGAGGGRGDWYAIAGSFRSQGQAQSRAAQLGGGWYVMNTAQCPNFTNGYWIATAGPFAKGRAQGYAGAARRFGAYVKTCH